MCGIAPVSRFENAPAGTHPTDFLPGCKSVISVGLRLVDGVIQSIFRNFEDGKTVLQSVYGTHGYTLTPNFHLLFSVYGLAQFVERNTDSLAMPTQVGPLQSGITMSQRHAAVAAGLGEFGWLSIVLDPAVRTQEQIRLHPHHGGADP